MYNFAIDFLSQKFCYSFIIRLMTVTLFFC